MLARVRWNNVVLAVVVTGVVALVVGWPLLGGGEVALPPPVADVAPAPTAVPVGSASPRRGEPAAVTREPRPRNRAELHRVRRREGAARDRGRPAVSPVPAVAAPAPVLSPAAPAVVSAPPPPAPEQEFAGFER